MLSSIRTFGPHLAGPKFPSAFFNPSKTFHGRVVVATATAAFHSNLYAMKPTTKLMGYNKQCAVLGGQQQIRFHSFTVLAEKSARFQYRPTRTDRDFVVVKLEQDEDGQKYLVVKRIGLHKDYFRKIFVPEDVLGFVQAMDEVLAAVEANRGAIESNTQDHLLVGRVDVKGKRCDFELELKVTRSLVEVEMRTVPNEVQPKRWVVLSLRQFHWVRQAIGQVLAEAGEQQQPLPEPPQFPEWLNYYGIPHSKAAASSFSY